MKIPTRIAWWLVRAQMEIAVLRLCWRGMPWLEARRRVGEATKLWFHREVCPQFGPPRAAPSVDGGGKGGQP